MSIDDFLYAPIESKNKGSLLDWGKIPLLWNRYLLTTILAGFPDALLAGGCLRDLIMGGKTKDLDIFFQVDYAEDAELLLRSVWPDITTDTRHSKSIYSSLADIVGVWETKTSIGLPVQFIGLYNDSFPLRVETLMPRFDFGICRICANSTTVYTTPEFVSDHKNNTLSLLCSDEDMTDEHKNRILKKYPQLVYVDKRTTP